MPTSSITERIRINNPKPLEELVAHMEESSKHFYDKKLPRSNVCTDTKRMDAFMKKALAKKGVTLETEDNSLKECVINISWDNDARVWTLKRHAYNRKRYRCKNCSGVFRAFRAYNNNDLLFTFISVSTGSSNGRRCKCYQDQNKK